MRILEISSSYNPETFIWEHINALNEYRRDSVFFFHPMKKDADLNKKNVFKLVEPKDLNLMIRLLGKIFKSFPKRYAFKKTLNNLDPLILTLFFFIFAGLR